LVKIMIKIKFIVKIQIKKLNFLHLIVIIIQFFSCHNKLLKLNFANEI
jgi:hypothetical protein